MNQGQARIPCPKCGANNFLGKTNCWQCGGSLPPPETFAPPVYTPPPPTPPGTIPLTVQIDAAKRAARPSAPNIPLPFSGGPAVQGAHTQAPPVPSAYSIPDGSRGK